MGGVLHALTHIVADAAQFFSQVDEAVADDHQTAREVISHLIFWRRHYVRVAWALVEGCPVPLRSGKFRELKALLAEQYNTNLLPALATRLARLQW